MSLDSIEHMSEFSKVSKAAMQAMQQLVLLHESEVALLREELAEVSGRLSTLTQSHALGGWHRCGTGCTSSTNVEHDPSMQPPIGPSPKLPKRPHVELPAEALPSYVVLDKEVAEAAPVSTEEPACPETEEVPAVEPVVEPSGEVPEVSSPADGVARETSRNVVNTVYDNLATFDSAKSVVSSGSDRHSDPDSPVSRRKSFRSFKSQSKLTLLFYGTDDPHVHSISGERMRSIFTSVPYDLLLCGLILLSCATIGVAADLTLGFDSPGFQRSLYPTEAVLCGLFLVELLARFFLCGWGTSHWRSFESVLNFVDLLVVLVPGVLFIWVLHPAGLGIDGNTSSAKAMQIIMLSRLARLVRVYRVAEKVHLFGDLKTFLRGIQGSALTFIWSVVLLVLLTYMFAVVGTVAISHPIQDLLESADGAEAELLQAWMEVYLGSVSRMMHTLALVLTGQTTSTNFLQDLHLRLGWSWLFFDSYSALMSLLILNLITATLVHNAFGQHQEEDRLRREQLLKEENDKHLADLASLFQLADADGDGTLTWKELKEGMKNPKLRKRWRALKLKPDEARSCFHLLDRDSEGKVPIDEFFQGLTRISGPAQARDLFRAIALLQDLIELQSGGPTNRSPRKHRQGSSVQSTSVSAVSEPSFHSIDQSPGHTQAIERGRRPSIFASA